MDKKGQEVPAQLNKKPCGNAVYRVVCGAIGRLLYDLRRCMALRLERWDEARSRRAAEFFARSEFRSVDRGRRIFGKVVY